MGQNTDVATPEQQESYIRPSVYDPATQTYTRLDPVKTSDWGTRSFSGYAQSQGYQDGGVVEQRYQQPVRTVDPTVTDYNRMLMERAQQEYAQGMVMPGRPAPAAPTPPAIAAEPNTRHARLYDPATQMFTPNPNYAPPTPPVATSLFSDRAPSYDMSGGNDGIGDAGGNDGGDAGQGGSDVATGGYLKHHMGYAQGGIASIPKFQAGGDMESDAFVIPADVVSALGNGSTAAGIKRLNENLGIALPIEGEGDGLSDDIPATIEGNQPARVADGEAYIPPDVVAQIGGGDPERGAAMLYALMDKVREAAHGKTDQQQEVDPTQVMPV
jgi:hypothetical protein